jgi:hypothetical protein
MRWITEATARTTLWIAGSPRRSLLEKSRTEKLFDQEQTWITAKGAAIRNEAHSGVAKLPVCLFVISRPGAAGEETRPLIADARRYRLGDREHHARPAA